MTGFKTQREYGDKRDYRKIDIFLDGKYHCSTTWSRTCATAKARFIAKRGIPKTGARRVKARFARD